MTKKDATVITRRKFFSFIGSGSIFATMAGFAGMALKYLTPNVLFEPSSSFTIGMPEDYPLDTINFLPDKKLFIINRDDEYSVISAVCTHLGCTVKVTSEDTFHCPCHGSRFDHDGSVTNGPAQRPLRRYEITLARNGQLMVDVAKEVDADYALIID